MDASGEVADLMVKESIQLTEESIKLLAAGCKNLTAFLYALAKDNKKLVGKTSMKRLQGIENLLHQGRGFERLPQIRQAQYPLCRDPGYKGG